MYPFLDRPFDTYLIFSISFVFFGISNIIFFFKTELLTGAVRKRPRLSIERSDSYTAILLKRMEAVLAGNTTLRVVRMGEMELDVQHLESMNLAMGRSSSGSSSSSSSGNGKRRRVADKPSKEMTYLYW